jgi:hypothetical protein
MGKKKSLRGSKKSTSSKPDVAENDVDLLSGDLRTASPVVRMRAFVGRLHESTQKVCKKLATWSDQNDVVSEAAGAAVELEGLFPALEDALATLEENGFSPPRTTYTASTEEGDHVSVLDKFREKYEDLMPADSMGDLTVIKKHPGKGGGLIVESSDGARMKVATSHVVKL